MSTLSIKYRTVILCAFAFPLLFSSCGIYSFSGNLPGGVKSIAIPVFENQTAEFGIVETLTDEVVGQFTRIIL